MAKMGQLKLAAQELGITSSTLRQNGWSTASPERIAAVKADPPEWLLRAREKKEQQQARLRRRRDTRLTAEKLGIRTAVVRERKLHLADVPTLRADPPEWLTVEQRRQREIENRKKLEALRAELRKTLTDAIHEAWFQELKQAQDDRDVDRIDTYWSRKARDVRQEVQQMFTEMTPEQIRARIHRENESIHDAGVVRARNLLHLARERGLLSPDSGNSETE